jgi:hypothetical protein
MAWKNIPFPKEPDEHLPTSVLALALVMVYVYYVEASASGRLTRSLSKVPFLLKRLSQCQRLSNYSL